MRPNASKLTLVVVIAFVFTSLLMYTQRKNSSGYSRGTPKCTDVSMVSEQEHVQWVYQNHSHYSWKEDKITYSRPMAAEVNTPSAWKASETFLCNLRAKTFRLWDFGKPSARSVGVFRMTKDHPMYRPPGDDRLIPIGDESVLKRICNKGRDGNPIYQFHSICRPDRSSYPWCPSYDTQIHMVEIKDVYLMSGFEDVINYWAYTSEYEYLHYLPMPWPDPTEIKHYDVLAFPHVSYYENAFGHWPIEELTNVLWLWTFAPPEAVILLPIQSRVVILKLLEKGIIKPRPWVLGNDKIHKYNFHANKAYFPFVTSQEHVATNPHGMFLANKYLSQLIVPKKRDREYIFISKRPGVTRRMLQHDELVAKMKVTFPEYDVIDGPPEKFGGFLDQCELFNNAKMVVSTHGGSLSSLVCSPKGQYVVEIGFEKAWPEDHQCTGRHMQLKYILIFADSGGMSTNVEINVDRVIGEIKRNVKL